MILCTSIPKYLPILFFFFFPPPFLCDLSAFSDNISESKGFFFFIVSVEYIVIGLQQLRETLPKSEKIGSSSS